LLKTILCVGPHQLRATLEELKFKRLDLLAMKTKDFKLGKIKEFLDVLKKRKGGVLYCNLFLKQIKNFISILLLKFFHLPDNFLQLK
jgi:hypothetical protein